MKKKSVVPHLGLVLPGAVSKGAYEAGVIQTLARNEVRIDHIAATSSGALNGITYAAALRCGCERVMTDRLVQTWIDFGGWESIVNVSWWGWTRRRGISDSSGLYKLLDTLIKPCKSAKRKDVEFRVIVAPLNGVRGSTDSGPATTYEKFLQFSGEDFDHPESLHRMFEAVTAACAFPGLYQPVNLKGLGPCVDGGMVNNAPVKYMIEEFGVSQILMPVPFPAFMPERGYKGGFAYFNHLVEILINERLYRDLKTVQRINHEISKLKKLVDYNKLTIEQLEAVLASLDIREIDLLEIRPERSTSGNPFSGFFSKRDRIRLVTEGREAALRALKCAQFAQRFEVARQTHASGHVSRFSKDL